MKSIDFEPFFFLGYVYFLIPMIGLLFKQGNELLAVIAFIMTIPYMLGCAYKIERFNIFEQICKEEGLDHEEVQS